MDPRTTQLQEREPELHSLMLRASEALIGEKNHTAIKGYNEVLDKFTKYHHDVRITHTCIGIVYASKY